MLLVTIIIWNNNLINSLPSRKCWKFPLLVSGVVWITSMGLLNWATRVVCPVGSRDFPRLWVASRRGSGVSPGAIREPRGAPAHLPNPRLHATFSYWSDTGAQARHWPSATSRPTVWLPQNGLPQLPKWATGSASDVLNTNREMRSQLPVLRWRCVANGRCGAKTRQQKLAGEQRANLRAHVGQQGRGNQIEFLTWYYFWTTATF